MGKVELRIEIDEHLLEQARATGVDVEAVAIHALQTALTEAANPARSEPGEEERARRWAEENAEAIRLYQERIEHYGVFGDDFRTW